VQKRRRATEHGEEERGSPTFGHRNEDKGTPAPSHREQEKGTPPTGHGEEEKGRQPWGRGREVHQGRHIRGGGALGSASWAPWAAHRGRLGGLSGLGVCWDSSSELLTFQKRERISCSGDVCAHVNTLNRECSFLIQRLVLFIHLSPPTSTMSVPDQQPDRWIKKEHSRFKVLT
jgi:hypothetical protein